MLELAPHWPSQVWAGLHFPYHADRFPIVERQGDTVWHGEMVVTVEREVPHSHVVDKNWEGYLVSKQSQPQARPQSPGFQCQEDKPPKLLALKTSGGWDGRRNCWFPRRLHLKSPHRLRTYINPPTLAFSTRARARKAPVAYRKWVK